MEKLIWQVLLIETGYGEERTDGYCNWNNNGVALWP